MDASDSNIDQVEKWIDEFLVSVAFDRPGAEQSLGRDLAGTVAQGIADAGLDRAEAPDGTAWAPNEPKYAAKKAQRYKISQHAPNYRTGQMLSIQSLLGQPLIRAEEVEMQYGTGEPPTRTATGVPLDPSDEMITDIEKALINSKKRPFYMLSDGIADDCLELTGKVVARWIEESW